MNTDDSNTLHPWIEPDLEARLTALVLGEASDFERDELERLVAERPELGLYRKRLEAMHRMLHEVASGESGEEQGEWKLSGERRAVVLARFGGESVTKKNVVVMSGEKRRVPWGLVWRVAACAMVAAIVLGLMFPATTGSLRRSQATKDTFAYYRANEYPASDTSSRGRLGVERELVRREMDSKNGRFGFSVGTTAPQEPGISGKGIVAFADGRTDESRSLAIGENSPVPMTAPALPPSPAKKPAAGGGGDWGKAPVGKTPIEESVDLGGQITSGYMSDHLFYNKLQSAAGAPNTSFAPEGTNTYSGGTTITGGGVLAITNPEPAAAPAAPTNLSRLSDTSLSAVTRGTEVKADSDRVGTDFSALADTRAGEKAKVQAGVPLVEEERMKSLTNLSGTMAADAPSAGRRKLAEKEVAAPAAVERPKADEKPVMEQAKRASDDLGSIALNQSGAAAAPATPAPAAKPRGSAADPGSGPAVVGEPVLEQQLMRQGNGNLALNGGVTEFDGFVDLGRKKEAAVNAPTAGATRDSTSDLQSRGGTKAQGYVALDSLSIGSGGVLAGAGGKEGSGGFGDEAPAEKRDELSRSAGAGGEARRERELSRMGRSSSVDKSMEESLELKSELEAVDGTKNHAIRHELPMAKNEASISNGTVSFGAGVSQIEKQEDFLKIADGDVALPGLRQVGENSAGLDWAGKDRSPEVDESVRDILALTPQAEVGNDRELSSLYASTESDVRFRMVGVPEEPIYDERRSELLNEVTATWESPTPAALDETSPSAEPFSTFSLHVSDVSFQLAKAALASGQWPETEKIRIEEFVNAFDYGDPMPGMGERVAARIDQAAHPFLQQRNLVRIALRTAEAGRSSGTPLRLTLLLDSSGSMERPDRRETVRRAVATLAGLLGENDRVTLVSFARQPRLVADAVAGNEAMKLAETVAALPSEGGTNLEAALQLAFEKAREHQDKNAQNRIVLLTDGAANLGDAKAGSLASQVEAMREAGIAFDAAGFGAEGLNDEILEALTRKGDGRYYLLDRPEDAEDVFAKQIAGALRPAAKNVKVQVEFNPDRVKSYKLLGFEKHRLETEDFRNDAVDAAEMAAAEAGVAVYQVEPNPAGQGDLGSVSVRFRDLDSGEMIERRWALPHLTSAPAADQGGDAILLATVASQFAAKLAGGPLGDVVDLGELASLAAALPDSPRVAELRTMIEQARAIEGAK